MLDWREGKSSDIRRRRGGERRRSLGLMKRKVVRGSSSRSSNSRRGRRKEMVEMKGTLARHLQIQLGQVSLFPPQPHQPSSSIHSPSNSSRLLHDQATEPIHLPSSTSPRGAEDFNLEDKDFILSQDFFCTPDYITPDNQQIFNSVDCYKENICPESPEKLNTVKNKRCRLDGITVNPLSPTLSGDHQRVELGIDFITNEVHSDRTMVSEVPNAKNYVSHSAVALRCRVMPPPCIRNPYRKDASDHDVDPFGNQRAKCAGFFPAITNGDGLSRYHTDFHEMEQIGMGNFSRVFKVLKRIDGCLYAVKQSTRLLHQETERRKALMEVQALAALGSHENIVSYYSSWFENDHLYIQMELCDQSLSIKKSSGLFTEGEVLRVLHQIAKALQFMHERGIVHLDVKPDNIYFKNGIYKLGDFGCASLLDNSLPIEEGDARYMPQELLNENYDHLDKVDVFSLGASIYELIRGSSLPESGTQFLNLKEGKLLLLPGHSMQLQKLLKVMMDPDPVQRPSAKELVENPIFDKFLKNSKP